MDELTVLSLRCKMSINVAVSNGQGDQTRLCTVPMHFCGNKLKFVYTILLDHVLSLKKTTTRTPRVYLVNFTVYTSWIQVHVLLL